MPTLFASFPMPFGAKESKPAASRKNSLPSYPTEKPVQPSQQVPVIPQARLDAFKDVLIEEGYELSAFTDNTDDTTLLRFLRAQKQDIDAAFQQFNEAQAWRKEHDIRGFYENVDIHYYDESRKMYPQWIGRRDNDGRAIYVFPVKHLTKKRLDDYLEKISSCSASSEHSKSDLAPRYLHFHALYESLLHFVFPLVSQLPRPDRSTPISSSTHIIDVSGVSLRQFWSIRKYLQEGSEIATAHYPETLGRVFVVGAPAFFKSIWDMISQWFDPVTRSKILLLSASETQQTLRSYIDPANLPKEYGGDLEWKWQDLPNLDTPARQLVDGLYQKTDRGEIFAKGPVIFEDGCIKLLGSENGKPRRNDFCPR